MLVLRFWVRLWFPKYPAAGRSKPEGCASHAREIPDTLDTYNMHAVGGATGPGAGKK